MKTNCNCPDCTFPDCSCWDTKTEIKRAQKYLGKFYGVDNYEDLVTSQSEHIARLQKKLPELKDAQPKRSRA